MTVLVILVVLRALQLPDHLIIMVYVLKLVHKPLELLQGPLRRLLRDGGRVLTLMLHFELRLDERRRVFQLFDLDTTDVLPASDIPSRHLTVYLPQQLGSVLVHVFSVGKDHSLVVLDLANHLHLELGVQSDPRRVGLTAPRRQIGESQRLV